jgi:hypothetical protein
VTTQWAIIVPDYDRGTFRLSDPEWEPWVLDSIWSDDDEADWVAQEILDENDDEWEYPDDVVIALRLYPCDPPPCRAVRETLPGYCNRLKDAGWQVFRVYGETERVHRSEKWDGKP